MKLMSVLVCLIVTLMAGCSRSQTAILQDQCLAGSKAACEELARAQQSSYEEQTESNLHQARPMIPSPAVAAPSGNRSP